MTFHWLFIHFLATIGFVLALVLLAHILRERRSPASTLAWLMAVLFVPYLGVPLYLVFGGRKMVRRAEAKPDLGLNRQGKPADGLPRQHTRLLEPDGGVFPASLNNHITFLPTGEQAFQAILELIEHARQSVCVATFILGKDSTGNAIVRALARKAGQGVRVRLLLDALGSVKIRRAFIAPLLKAGGEVAFFMPMLHLPFRGRANLRNHRKLLVCDNRVGVLGGMNLAAEYMGPQCGTAGRWRDLSLMIQGPVVDHIAGIFRSDWAFVNKTPLGDGICGDSRDAGGRQGDPQTGGLTQLVASGPDVPNDSLRNAILTEIFRAKARIWIVTPYFVPDELILEALCIAVSRKVDVTVIVPKESNHRLADIVREGYLTRIQEVGGTPRLYEPGMLHAKAILIDDSLAMVGSANMDMRSLLLNYEIALCLYDAKQIGWLEAWMLDVMEGCSARNVQGKRSLGLIESMGRLLAPLL